MFRLALSVVCLFSVAMIPSVFAEPPNVIYWHIPSFTGSLDIRLHTQTPIPLHGTTFSIIIGKLNGPIPWGVPPLNVTVNHQTFLVYHTDSCCYEAASGLLTNLNITASAVFHLSTTVPNGTYDLSAWIGFE